MRFGIIMVIDLLLLAAVQIGGVTTASRSIEHTQLDYVVEEECRVPYEFVLYIYEIILVIVAVYLAYVTRDVEATLRNNTSIIKGTISTLRIYHLFY